MIEPQLAWRGVQEVGSANDVGHPLGNIVHDYRQLVGDNAVAAADDEVAAAALQRLTDLALQAADEAQGALIHPDAYGVVRGKAKPARTAGARIAPVMGDDLPARAIAVIGQIVVEPLFDGVLIKVQPLALVDHLAVPVQAIAVQRVKYVRSGPGEVAGGIQIFHAHQPGATLMTGIQITGDGSEQRAEMQKATGGGSEAAYVTGGRHGADSVADSAEAGCLPGERRG